MFPAMINLLSAKVAKFATPVTLIVMFPLGLGIDMLLLPFCINPLLIVVMLPVVAITVVVPKLPVFALPLTLSDDNVPTDVMFGCAAV